MFESAVGRPTDLMNISKLPDPAHYGSEVRPLNYVLVQFQIYATVKRCHNAASSLKVLVSMYLLSAQLASQCSLLPIITQYSIARQAIPIF